MMRFIVSLITLFIAIATLSLITLTTPAGLKISMRIAQLVLPGKLQYESIEGIVTGPLIIHQLNYKLDKFSIRAYKVEVNWNLSALLSGKLSLQTFNINNATITLPPPHSSKNKDHHFTLPLKIAINNGNISRLHIIQLPERKETYINAATLYNIDLNDNSLQGHVIASFSKPQQGNIELVISGKPSNYQFKITGAYEKYAATANGHGSLSEISVRVIKSSLLDGNIQGTAYYRWVPPIKWRANLNIEKINLSKIHKHLVRHINMKLVTEGDWNKKNPTFNFDANIFAPGISIKTKGGHHRQWDAKWEMSINQLGNLTSLAKGTIHSSGTLSGHNQFPTVHTKAQVNNFSWKKNTIKSLLANLTVDLSQQNPSTVSVKSSAIHIPSMLINKLAFEASGTLASHKFSATVITSTNQTGKINTKLATTGSYINKQWKGQLQKWDSLLEKYGRWRLKDKTCLVLLKNSAALLAPLCFQSSKSSVCLNGTFNALSTWKAKLSANHFPINKIIKAATDKASVNGTVNLDIIARGNGKKISSTQSQVDFYQGILHITNPALKLKPSTLQSRVTINTSKNGLAGAVTLTLDKNNRGSAIISMPEFNLNRPIYAAQPIQGNIIIGNLDLSKFAHLFPPVIKPSGSIQANFTLSGQAASPDINGSLQLKSGKVVVPYLNVTLNKILINLAAFKNYIRYSAKAYSGKKLISITGKTDLKAKNFPTTLNLKANNALIVNTPLYVIYATPNLNLTTKGTHLHIKGTVTIPQANLKPIDFGDTVTLPKDTIIIGMPKQKESQWKTFLDIETIIGNKVVVDARGFLAHLAGRIHIHDEPYKTTIANGAIILKNATFTAIGKTLSIEDGSGIHYANSPIGNPNLDIRANRTIKVSFSQNSSSFFESDIQVGLNIQGTADKPSFNLYSSAPSLSQADIISYLLFDQPANSNTPGNISLLLQAVEALHVGGDGPGGVANTVTQDLGLTEFGVQSQSTIDTLGGPIGQSQNSFVVGRYITPSIYLRYSQGLILPVNTFQVRYLFGGNWALQTDSGSLGSGADILYTIQR